MYLARLLVECIPEVAAGRIMEWLREVAGIIAKQKRGMMWTTPVGFVVLHENRKLERGACRYGGSHDSSLPAG